MTAQFSHGLFAAPKRRHRIRLLERAYLALGTEVNFDGIHKDAQNDFCLQNIHRGERLVIRGYEYTGTPKDRRIRINFAAPSFIMSPINENLTPTGHQAEVVFDRRPIHSDVPQKNKWVQLRDLRYLHVRNVTPHTVASSDAFERHMIDRDLVRAPGGKSFRPIAATLWKEAGKEMTVALHQQQSMRMKLSNEIDPILFTQPHNACPSRAKDGVPLSFEHFKIAVVSLT